MVEAQIDESFEVAIGYWRPLKLCYEHVMTFKNVTRIAVLVRALFNRTPERL